MTFWGSFYPAASAFHSSDFLNRRLKSVRQATTRSRLLGRAQIRGVDVIDGQRPPMVYRGSRRRLKRLRWRGNFSFEMWLVLAWVLFLLFVVIPWMIRQGHEPHGNVAVDAGATAAVTTVNAGGRPPSKRLRAARRRGEAGS